ncbi:uncharacterized protein LOC117317820 [Pecten maximus]|uniref:uncharacterized protein LOC117317820 n=1 Tax=Pecten maximus TaxID=6579 RepID=UPI00145895BA|nr:uncharacterized protein LOC117317820 [Pecten maximus]
MLLFLCVATFLTVTGHSLANDLTDTAGPVTDREIILDLQRRLAVIETQQTVYVTRISDLEQRQQNDHQIIADLVSHRNLDQKRISDLDNHLETEKSRVSDLKDQLKRAQRLISKFSAYESQINDMKRTANLDKNLTSSKRQLVDIGNRQENEDSQYDVQTLDLPENPAMDIFLPVEQGRKLNPVLDGSISRHPAKEDTPLARVAEPSGNPDVIAFHAYLSFDYNRASTHMEIRFDRVTTNVGHGYSGHTGTFTCPSSGVYMFTWTVCIQSHFITTELIRNGAAIAAGFSGDTDYRSVGTSVTLVELNQNDEVWVRVDTYNAIPAAGHIIGNPGLTSFSGFKVR